MRIGLEIHVQLPTRSKMFCSCPTDGGPPNSAVCPTCLGMPGSRPTLNRAALEMGLRLAKLFDCQVPERTWFARKTYFYPDLAKHYQVTQHDNPVGEHGAFDFRGKEVRIRRVHLEEDPGSIRRAGRPGEELSLVVYNRSGMPLVEIVTEPDLSSPAEARQFLSDMLTEIRHTIGLSGEGEQTVRADCNISVGEERVEVKNVTGLKNMERALKYEAVRQTKMLRSRRPVLRETRRYDEERKVTVAVRKKEFEEDYGYIGEPDLGVFHIRAMAEELENKETPLERARRLELQYGLAESTARQLVNTSMRLCDLFERMAADLGAKVALNVTGQVSGPWFHVKDSFDQSMEDAVFEAAEEFWRDGITDSELTIRLSKILGTHVTVEETLGLDVEDSSVKDRIGLNEAVEKAVEENPGIFEDYAKNERAANRLIGEVKKSTGGTFSSQEIVAAVKARLSQGP